MSVSFVPPVFPFYLCRLSPPKFQKFSVVSFEPYTHHPDRMFPSPLTLPDHGNSQRRHAIPRFNLLKTSDEQEITHLMVSNGV